MKLNWLFNFHLLWSKRWTTVEHKPPSGYLWEIQKHCLHLGRSSTWQLVPHGNFYLALQKTAVFFKSQCLWETVESFLCTCYSPLRDVWDIAQKVRKMCYDNDWFMSFYSYEWTFSHYIFLSKWIFFVIKCLWSNQLCNWFIDLWRFLLLYLMWYI